MRRTRELRVTVADTGIGIPRDKQDKIFQPFQRAGQETGPIEGTGIGLVITKRLAELMTGSVGFVSATNEAPEAKNIPVIALGNGRRTRPLRGGVNREGR